MLLTSMMSAGSKRGATSVAIVVDSVTNAIVGGSVEKYAESIRAIGKNTFIINVKSSIDAGKIRDTLQYLYSYKRLEGAVLIGDIPIPMVRAGNHLTTAFKMDPALSWQKSSVPSDRFYDDFHLKFNYIKNDEHNNLLRYYEIADNSPQTIRCNIYSARIKPSKSDTKYSYYELIASFLERAAESKKHKERLDYVMHFGGHGNSSESFNARIDENMALYEQLGFVSPSEKVCYLNYDEDRYVKSRFLKALASPDLDIAFIHSHGAVKKQYLSKQPYTFVPKEHLEYAKAQFRDRLRSAKDTLKIKAEIIRQYDIPADWLDGFSSKALTTKDSLQNSLTDVSIEDLKNYNSGVKVLILDACFNGAFIYDDYIAAEYAFGKNSSTLAVFGNSVNIIQDHHKNAMMGLLSYGVSIGNMAKYNMTLESHIFGDPTFFFEGKKSGFGNFDNVVTFPTLHDAYKMYKSSIPDISCLGMRLLYHNGKISTEKIMESLTNDNRMNVRMGALSCIAGQMSDYLPNAIIAGLNDSYELIRRMSARYAENNGSELLIKSILKHYYDPLETSRVRYHLLNSIKQYKFSELKNQILPQDYNRFKRMCMSDSSDISCLTDSTVSVKEKLSIIKAQRNSCLAMAVEPMLKIIDCDLNENLRLAAVEALGWYKYSYKREFIVLKCKSLAEKTTDKKLKRELYKTIRRLTVE